MRLDADVGVPIGTFLDYALPAAILLRRQWFWSIYCTYNIQVVFDEGDNWTSKPLLITPTVLAADWQELGALTISRVNEFTESQRETGKELLRGLSRYIAEGHYVELRLNEHYLACRPIYRRHHYDIHINVVCGIDDRERQVHLLGYDHRFCESKVSFEEFLEGFYTPPLEQFRQKESQFQYWKGLWLWRPKEATHLNEQFPNLSQIEGQLEDYLVGRPTNPIVASPTPCHGDIAWGLNTYESWFRYLDAVIGGRRALDLRATRLFWEHKCVGVQRALTLIKAGVPIDDETMSLLEQLRQTSKLIHMDAVAYIASKNLFLLKKIGAAIRSLKDVDQLAAEKVLHQISRSRIRSEQR
jgi:hypothetical protein